MNNYSNRKNALLWLHFQFNETHFSLLILSAGKGTNDAYFHSYDWKMDIHVWLDIQKITGNQYVLILRLIFFNFCHTLQELTFE